MPVGDASVFEPWEVRCALPYIILTADVGLDFGRDSRWVFVLRVILRLIPPAERLAVVDYRV